MTDAIDAHQTSLLTAFVRLLRAEQEERDAKAAIKAVEERYEPVLRQARRAQEDAWEDIAKLMAETGEPEVMLPGDHCDYKIATSSAPEKVDVPDVAAVPDEFLSKEPKKKEILEHLKKLRAAGQPLPNWATITRGLGSLCYKPVKKEGRMTAGRNLYCCQCGAKVVARLTDGREVYPHRPDLSDLPFWKCDTCGNHVGCHHKTKDRTRPLGNIPTRELKNARQHIHRVLDPIWQNGKMPRGQLYARIAKALGREEYHTAEIRTIQEARAVYTVVRDIARGTA